MSQLCRASAWTARAYRDSEPGRHGSRRWPTAGGRVLCGSCTRAVRASSSPAAHQRGVDESAPYDFGWMRRTWAYYSESKACAEQAVLRLRNGDGETARCGRISLGTGDTHLIPRLIERQGRAGSVELARARTWWTLRMSRMLPSGIAGSRCVRASWRGRFSGRCTTFEVDATPAVAASPTPAERRTQSHGEPVNCWQWIDEVLKLAGMEPVHKSMSFELRGGSEQCARQLIGARLRGEPPMTRVLAAHFRRRTGSTSRPRGAVSGYEPRVDRGGDAAAWAVAAANALSRKRMRTPQDSKAARRPSSNTMSAITIARLTIFARIFVLRNSHLRRPRRVHIGKEVTLCGCGRYLPRSRRRPVHRSARSIWLTQVVFNPPDTPPAIIEESNASPRVCGSGDRRRRPAA